MHAGEPVVEAGILEDQADGLAHLVLLVDDVEAVQRGPAAGRAGEGAENADGGGLAGAVGPQEAEDFTGFTSKLMWSTATS